jgi:hypothetical protein
MAESGNRPAVRISQKRLSIVVAVLGLLGCLVLGLVWWDSEKNISQYNTNTFTIGLGWSLVAYEAHQFQPDVGFQRECLETYGFGGWPLFTRPVFRSDFVRIPIYLILLAYLATLLLIWVVLMNRLARRGNLWRRGLHPLSGAQGNCSSSEGA